jgi:phage terminase large subunit GpA-like protein
MYEQAQKTPDLMKGFVNTVLGLPFEEEAEAPERQRLYDRREAYRIGIVPEPGFPSPASSVFVRSERMFAVTH